MAPIIMSRSVQFARQYRQRVFPVFVLAVLISIGLWGHANHWQFSAQHAEPMVPRRDLAFDATAPDDGRLLATPSRIEFPSSEAAGDLGLEAAPAQRRPMAREVSAAGVVCYEPSRLAQLSSRVSGTVWRVEKQVGQEIHSGDILAVIDAPALGQAKADFLRAIADVQLRQKAHERFQSFTAGEVPTKAVQEAETELRKARVDLFNAQQALISLGLTIDLKEWEALSEEELQHRIKFLGLGEAIVSQLDPNATTASLLPIFAPFSGLVIGRNLTMGEAVSPTQSHFEIADVARMWIVLNVREPDADDLELGQRIEFTAGSAIVTSSISWMSTAVDEKTRTVEVRCECDNPEIIGEQGKPTGKRLLRANLFGVGKIRLHENADALVVPTRAIQWDGQSHVLFVRIDARTFEARRVRLGIVSGEFSEIAEGISASEPVVIEGSHLLKAELQRVAVTRPP